MVTGPEDVPEKIEVLFEGYPLCDVLPTQISRTKADTVCSGIISAKSFLEFEKKKNGNREKPSSGTKWTYEKSLRRFNPIKKVQ